MFVYHKFICLDTLLKRTVKTVLELFWSIRNIKGIVDYWIYLADFVAIYQETTYVHQALSEKGVYSTRVQSLSF